MTVRLGGVFEGLTCDHLRELAIVAVDAGATEVRVDASAVTFAGSPAIRALVEAKNVVLARGGQFELVDPSPPLQELLGILGLDTVFA